MSQDLTNRVLRGDCIEQMQRLASGSVDFILTDPPYMVRYRDRHGRRIANDNNPHWLKPAYAEMHRVLKPGGICVTFFGWNAILLFSDAWEAAGFRIVGNLVFCKDYASSQRLFKHHHEQAYILAKGRPLPFGTPISDVLPWDYTGNRLHPTQKPVRPLKMIIEQLTKPGDLVLDPFCGSGSTLVAAASCGRQFMGIELSAEHAATAALRAYSTDG